MAEQRGSLTDPLSWGKFVQEVGIPGATIFALLAMLGYLALSGVPAILKFAQAIQDSTQAAAVRQAQILKIEQDQANTEEQVIRNQAEIINNETKMIDQHGDIVELLRNEQSKRPEPRKVEKLR